MEIIKRNQTINEYNPDKIYKAILSAYKEHKPVLEDNDYELCKMVTTKVEYDINDLEHNGLLDAGLFTVYENYVGYRIQRDIERYGYGDQYYARFKVGRL